MWGLALTAAIDVRLGAAVAHVVTIGASQQARRRALFRAGILGEVSRAGAAGDYAAVTLRCVCWKRRWWISRPLKYTM